jgi:hypothetical protein
VVEAPVLPTDQDKNPALAGLSSRWAVLGSNQ